MITPNWMTQLPGYSYHGDDPSGYIGRDEVARFLERYASSYDPALQCGAREEGLALTAPRVSGEQ